MVVTHLVTSMCNARCKTCNLWKKTREHKDDMTKEEIFRMLDKAKEARISGYVAWGGEPLLRKDLPEILHYAKNKKISTTVITNGYFLKDRCDEIARFTDFLIVSIDANDELHDEMRGVKGMRERAIEGIVAYKNRKTDTKIIINCTVSKLNLGKIDGLIELSRDLGILIAFEPMEIIQGYNEHLQPDSEELRTAFSRIIKYKKSGYKIVNSVQYIKNFAVKKKYVCHAPKFYITVDAHGNIFSCEFRKNPWGNIKEKSFKEIFSSDDFKRFCKQSEKCNLCNVSCVIESSLAYKLDPLFMLDKLKHLDT
ncbi:DUF3463 domain-containing protein [archaeon]|nr:DUF3463 domain-containing protein [archaeon]